MDIGCYSLRAWQVYVIIRHFIERAQIRWKRERARRGEGPTPEEIAEGKGAEVVPLTHFKVRAIVQGGLSRLFSEARKELALAYNKSLDHQAQFDQCVDRKRVADAGVSNRRGLRTALKNNLELARLLKDVAIYRAEHGVNAEEE